MNNPILTNLNSEQLSEIIMEELMGMSDTEDEKYAEDLVAELFHSFC